MLLIVMHRLLQSFMLPPLNSLLILFAGLWWLQKRRQTGKILIGLGIITIYIQSTPFFASHINQLLEFPPLKNGQIKNAQAIVVLGGGINTNSFEYPSNTVPSPETLIRLNYAAYLAHKYPKLPIVTSGGYNGMYHTEGRVMRDILLNSYMVTNTIWMEEASRNTEENAKYTAKILLEKNITTAAIVTQAYHERRACMLFKKYGITPIIAASTDYIYPADSIILPLAFIPSASAMRYTARAIHEIIGYWVYRIELSI